MYLSINDLDCEELKSEYLKKEKSYCPKSQFGFLCFDGWKENRYGSKEEIFMEYAGRC